MKTARSTLPHEPPFFPFVRLRLAILQLISLLALVRDAGIPFGIPILRRLYRVPGIQCWGRRVESEVLWRRQRHRPVAILDPDN